MREEGWLEKAGREAEQSLREDYERTGWASPATRILLGLPDKCKCRCGKEGCANEALR